MTQQNNMTVEEIQSKYKEIYAFTLHTISGPVVYEVYKGENGQYYTVITDVTTIAAPYVVDDLKIPDIRNQSFSFFISDFEISRYDSDHVFLETLAELKNSIQLSKDQLDMLLNVVIETRHTYND